MQISKCVLPGCEEERLRAEVMWLLWDKSFRAKPPTPGCQNIPVRQLSRAQIPKVTHNQVLTSGVINLSEAYSNRLACVLVLFHSRSPSKTTGAMLTVCLAFSDLAERLCLHISSPLPINWGNPTSREWEDQAHN